MVSLGRGSTTYALSVELLSTWMCGVGRSAPGPCRLSGCRAARLAGRVGYGCPSPERAPRPRDMQDFVFGVCAKWGKMQGFICTKYCPFSEGRELPPLIGAYCGPGVTSGNFESRSALPLDSCIYHLAPPLVSNAPFK